MDWSNLPVLYGDPGAGGEDRPARGEDGEVGGGSQPGERGRAQAGDSAGQESCSSLLNTQGTNH